MVDWQAIKTEYITTATSYRKLAGKYGVPYTNIGKKAKEEGWIALKQQYADEQLTKTLDAISEQQVDRAARFQTVADKLLNKIEAIVDGVDAADMNPKALRSLTAAVKDLKEIQNIKSDLDRQEQQARIDNLRKQAQKDEDSNAPTLVVEGLPEEFKV